MISDQLGRIEHGVLA